MPTAMRGGNRIEPTHSFRGVETTKINALALRSFVVAAFYHAFYPLLFFPQYF
jgi:hypothetical protein